MTDVLVFFSACLIDEVITDILTASGWVFRVGLHRTAATAIGLGAGTKIIEQEVAVQHGSHLMIQRNSPSCFLFASVARL